MSKVKQYDNIDYEKFNCSLEELITQKNIDYYNYFIIVNYLIKNKDKKYVLELLKNKNFAIKELENIYEDVKKQI